MKPFENIKLSPSHVMYQYDLIGYREYDKGFNPMERDKSNSIKIYYIDKDMPKIEFTDKGDWIDLRSRVELDYKAGDYLQIPLGIVVKIPQFKEAIVAPRSSTFKKYGIIMANSIGIIDNSYCGPNDEWNFIAYALKDGHIDKYDRICQFRLFDNMNKNTNIIEIEEPEGETRGGIGSTGVQ